MARVHNLKEKNLGLKIYSHDLERITHTKLLGRGGWTWSERHHDSKNQNCLICNWPLKCKHFHLGVLSDIDFYTAAYLSTERFYVFFTSLQRSLWLCGQIRPWYFNERVSEIYCLIAKWFYSPAETLVCSLILYKLTRRWIWTAVRDKSVKSFFAHLLIGFSFSDSHCEQVEMADCFRVRHTQSNTLKSCSLLSLHCVDLSTDISMSLHELPCLEWLAVLGHISPPNRLNERRMVLLPKLHTIIIWYFRRTCIKRSKFHRVPCIEQFSNRHDITNVSVYDPT